jgi:hypothetical protein
MAGRNTSTRAQAEHYRQLAEWTSDARTQHILMEMARELEECEAGDAADAGAEPEQPPLPRSLS